MSSGSGTVEAGAGQAAKSHSTLPIDHSSERVAADTTVAVAGNSDSDCTVRLGSGRTDGLAKLLHKREWIPIIYRL